jgi:hypothetical protein
VETCEIRSHVRDQADRLMLVESRRRAYSCWAIAMVLRAVKLMRRGVLLERTVVNGGEDGGCVILA